MTVSKQIHQFHGNHKEIYIIIQQHVKKAKYATNKTKKY